MAGDAEKKAQKKYEETRALYSKIMIGVYVVYVLFKVWPNLGEWGFFGWLGCLLLAGINYGAFSTMIAFLKDHRPDSSWRPFQDVLFISWFVTFGTIVSEWFWLVFLVIPAYLLYLYGGTLLDYLMPSSSGGEKSIDQMTDKEKKKMEKKERQSNRVQYR